MPLPSFSSFLDSVDKDKVDYDLSQFIPEDFKHPMSCFSAEQFSVVTQLSIALSKVMLLQYHNWLSENLPQLPDE
jgi:hypothetical protein